MGGLGQRLVRRVEEVGVGPLAPATDATTQLVQLAQAEAVGPVEDQRVGVGDVQAGLDDRRADEDVEAPLPEVEDDLLEPVLAHLAVGGLDAGLRHELTDAGGRPLDRADVVVDVEDLPLAHELAVDRRGHLLSS